MTGRVFVDTNVLVYRHDATEPSKMERARLWIEHLWRQESGRMSIQVVQEFYSTVTRKLSPGLEPDAARELVRPYFAWRPLATTPLVINDAWHIESRYGLSWWDSLIVAAAQRAECDWLLTEDLAEGAEFGAVRVVSPFTSLPQEL